MDNQERDGGYTPDDEALEHIIHHAGLPETRISKTIDGAIARIGSFISWFWVLLLLVICLNVFMKNVLHLGSIQLEEIQWHIYSILFLLGLSYAFVQDDHVRVDILFERFSPRGAAWVETLGILIFLFPFLGVLTWYTVPFVVKSFQDGERSMSPAGLSNYWVLKSVLLVAIILLLLAAFARLTRCVSLLARSGTSGAGEVRK